jgi:hypothetical protein
VNYYHIWCNLKDSSKDLDFCENVNRYLVHLRSEGLIDGFNISRRKFGFSPPVLGDFHIVIETTNLDRLDKAFTLVAQRTDEVEALHAPVWSAVRDLQTALYRDFPDR